jgi:hypothetical protein
MRRHLQAWMIVLAAAALVVAVAPTARAVRHPVECSFQRSRLSISGVDAIFDGDDGKVLEVKGEGGRTRRLAFSADAADAGNR